MAHDVTETIEPAGSPSTEVLGFRLSVIDGADSQAWEQASARCSIGSEEVNDLRIAHRTVSRFHCEILMESEGARVRDLGSRNGTVLDGVRVTDGFVRSGSLLKLGAVTVRFELIGRTSRLLLSSKTSFHGVIGESVAMRRALALIERAALSDTTVLLEGETGTGKGRVADAIHAGSARKEGTLVVVDCGALPATLLESELFGHEKGAFTGATERRIGAFEEASGGTVFLDEIGEMPIDLQPKLLRVIESREIRRLGTNQHRKVDVRVVAATHRDLRKEVNDGRFRADLYFRLAVLRIVLPPLRERIEDIPSLVEELLRLVGATAEQARALRTPEMMTALARSAWPGNVRELRNHIERCLVLDEALAPMDDAVGDQPALTPALSPSGERGSHGDRTTVDTKVPYPTARRRAIDAFERDYVAALLREHGGKITAAAAAADLDRVYLYKLAKRHGLRST